MEDLRLVFNQTLNMVVTFWNTALNQWGVFGGFIIFTALLRKVANVFNKLKS